MGLPYTDRFFELRFDAGGDEVTGAATVILAAGARNRAAHAIDAALAARTAAGSS